MPCSAKLLTDFKSLENQGVPVLFRPLHEMNGEWFWWGLTSYNQKDNERISLYKQALQENLSLYDRHKRT